MQQMEAISSCVAASLLENKPKKNSKHLGHEHNMEKSNTNKYTDTDEMT